MWSHVGRLVRAVNHPGVRSYATKYHEPPVTFGQRVVDAGNILVGFGAGAAACAGAYYGWRYYLMPRAFISKDDDDDDD